VRSKLGKGKIMEAIRQIYDSLPDVISVPAEMRRRKVEIIILPLDENETETILENPRFC